MDSAPLAWSAARPGTVNIVGGEPVRQPQRSRAPSCPTALAVRIDLPRQPASILRARRLLPDARMPQPPRLLLLAATVFACLHVLRRPTAPGHRTAAPSATLHRWASSAAAGRRPRMCAAAAGATQDPAGAPSKVINPRREQMRGVQETGVECTAQRDS